MKKKGDRGNSDYSLNVSEDFEEFERFPLYFYLYVLPG
jgi:hypothetical protein